MSSLAAVAPVFGLEARSLCTERQQRPPGWTERLWHTVAGVAVTRSSRLRTRALSPIVAAVERHADVHRDLGDRALAEAATELRLAMRLRGLDDLALVGQAFSLVREAAGRHLETRHFDVQLVGGLALLKGWVAEMGTGEGKTLTATLAAGAAALAGIPVHVVTVNDYLAARDAEWMGPVYRALGLRVGVVVHGEPPPQRRAAYRADVTYVTNKEIAFDYLRDRVTLGGRADELRLRIERLRAAGTRADRLILRGLHFAIVDEADSVLIDEARTPLILSGRGDPAAQTALAADALILAEHLQPESDYRLLLDERRVELSRRGEARLEELTAGRGGLWEHPVVRAEMVRLAIAAQQLFHRDEHYLVRDGKVQIIDEYTGRIMADRSWSEGLHQLIEIKEGLAPTIPPVPLARITYQRFFRRYRRLAGMTGTAAEVAGELWSVYRLPVARIPPNRPCRRRHRPDRICPSADAKWQLIAERAQALHAEGRPVLLGTRSVAASERASARLAQAGLAHEVLSAAQDADEARIIARAGESGRIVVATNMAGRGTDIRLAEGVAERGGLHVIVSERHEAGRIDRQLAGRCGRQGEPGSVEAILSLEDPLLEMIRDRLLAGLLLRLAPGAGAWAGRLLIRHAQRRAERLHARQRRRLLRADERQGTLFALSGGLE